MSDTPTAAPTLSDEQIDSDWLQVKSCWLRHIHDADRIDTWLAAVIARAKREERERIARMLRVRADVCTDERDRVTTHICADYALNVRMREAGHA